MTKRALLAALLILTPAVAHADSITVYSVRSPHGLSWKSPRALLASTVRNSLSFGKYTRRIGHVFIELDTGGKKVLTGMTNVSRSDESKALFKKGLGLGVLFNDFAGELEKPAHLQAELDARYQSGKLSFAKFEISRQTGKRLATYLDQYVARGEEDHYFGGDKEARDGKGAGCSGFGVSFLELAGVLTPKLKEAWLEKVNIPQGLIGRKDGRVSPLKLVFSKLASRWATSEEPHKHLEIYEPQKMSDWMDAMSTAASAGSIAGVRAVSRGNARGIVVDARDVPTPTDSIWKRPATKGDSR
jgi:hypothetical protein